jgi:hypothetical protein
VPSPPPLDRPSRNKLRPGQRQLGSEFGLCSRCGNGFGNEVEWNGRLVDVLTLVGATPDAVTVRRGVTDQDDETLVVVEAKCQVPFHMTVTGVLRVKCRRCVTVHSK